MNKQFGAMYLILGTCVAAGMLGLPIVTAAHHLSITFAMIFSAWILMTIGAWCLLQVTLTMPTGSNLVSMSQQTLGRYARYVTWVIYLLLLYSLICAYLAACSDLLEHVFHYFHVNIPRTAATILATIILGGVVIHGIRLVDLTNRLLMSTKLIIALLVIISVAPFVHASNLTLGNMHWNNHAFSVIICAFGYAIILPSIRDYLGNNAKQLKRVTLIGSVLPVILYVVWILVIQGALNRGQLIDMNHSADTNSLLVMSLVHLTHYTLIKTLAIVFISICSITGFLGVSLCLVDFLSDGTGIKKSGAKKLLLAIFAFLPPMLIVIFDPAIFTRALSWAGYFCVYILILLPIAMRIKQRFCS